LSIFNPSVLNEIMPLRGNSWEPEALPPRVKADVRTIIGWPTETVHVFHDNAGAELGELPSVILVFVPGNPGCVGWYTPLLVDLVTKLGSGFAARGLSYAGHSGSDELTNVEQWHNNNNLSMERDSAIPWTIEGQVRHKISFLDTVLSEWKDLREQHEQKNSVSSKSPSLPRFVFLAHSIGAHMVSRVCILRPDILQQTDLLVQLMPYMRMKAHRFQQKLLNLGASYPNILIGLGKTLTILLKAMPYQAIDSLMKSIVEDQDGRTLAVRLARQPRFARNFFELGTEEIRDVPEEVDYFALRCK
jgi:hypothetical protein